MKRSFLSLLLAASSFALPAAAQTPLTGDMNGDGRLTIDDVTLLVKAVMDFSELDGDADNAGKPYVNLGLTSGTLWATCNVGAESPEALGHYFAWGETTPKNLYYESNYKFVRGEKETLPLVNDAARVQWGGAWRIPSEAEMRELCNECEWEWTSQNGRKGYLVKSRINSASIFLPAAGVSSVTEVQGINDKGFYWTSSFSSDHSDAAVCLDFISGRSGVSAEAPFYGATIRPVLAAKH